LQASAKVESHLAREHLDEALGLLEHMVESEMKPSLRLLSRVAMVCTQGKRVEGSWYVALCTRGPGACA